MNCKKRFVSIISVLVVSTLLFTGCKVGDTAVYFSGDCSYSEAFKIGPLKCKMKEAKVYLANYKNLYGKIDGTSLWTEDYDTDAMQNSIKDAVIQHLTKVYALNLYAENNDISLSDDEEEQIKLASEEYYSSLNKTEKKYMGVSKSDIKEMYEHYALAEKVYYSLMGSVDEEVSEDEARVMDAEIFYVTNEKTAKSIQKRLKNGESFETLANSYNEGTGQVKVSFARNTYPEAVEEAAFKLDNDEYTGPVDDGSGKYYFIYCIDKYDEELSEENKSNVIESRQKQVIEDIISNLEDNYYSSFNTKAWNKVSIDTSDDIQTDSFFSVLNEYISY